VFNPTLHRGKEGEVGLRGRRGIDGVLGLGSPSTDSTSPPMSQRNVKEIFGDMLEVLRTRQICVWLTAIQHRLTSDRDSCRSRIFASMCSHSLSHACRSKSGYFLGLM
jgi:hypothetical protein